MPPWYLLIPRYIELETHNPRLWFGTDLLWSAIESAHLAHCSNGCVKAALLNLSEVWLDQWLKEVSS